MKGLKVFIISLSMVVILPICAVLSLCTPAGAVECTATVSPDLKLHIPAVEFDTGLYSADMQYTPSNDGIIWFDLTGADVVDTLNCDNPAFLFPVSGNYFLNVPSIAVGADKYWAIMQYVPETAAAQTKTAAASSALIFKVINANIEGVIPPPGTDRVPKNMMFSSYIIYDEGSGFPKVKIPMKSDLITLVQDPLAPLTSPGFSFKAVSGFLYVGDATCSINPNPDDPTGWGTCSVEGMGVGLFYIDSLTIEYANTSSLQITMKYHMWFNPNQIVVKQSYCHPSPSGCQEISMDYSQAIVGAYAMLHLSEAQAGSISASGWHIFPGLGYPCNGCGWTYAEKVYPEGQKISHGLHGFYQELRTNMVLYE